MESGLELDQPHVLEIAAVLRQLTSELISGDDLDAALQTLARTSAEAIGGRAWCGITIIRGGSPTSAAASEKIALAVEELQHSSGDGPMMAAIAAREIVFSRDLNTEDRWPDWCKEALDRGVQAVLSVPLDVDSHVIGALSLYAAKPESFPPDVALTTMLIADHASLLLAALLDRSRAAGVTQQLTAALANGGTVNRAIGIVMAQRGCSAEDALDVLQQASHTLSVPLHEVADRLVSTVSQRA